MGVPSFVNPIYFIENVLYHYNYLDQNQIWKISQILQALQGYEPNISDTDYNNPQDYWDWLQNELTFAQSYIDTVEGNTSSPTYIDFYDLVSSRQNNFYWMLTQINPATNQLYQPYEIPYNERPTYFQENDFQNLYENYFLPKRTNGEWNSIFDCINIPLIQNCDTNIQQNQNNLNTMMTIQQYQNMINQQIASYQKQDQILVNSLNYYQSQILGLINAMIPIWEKPYINYQQTITNSDGTQTQAIYNPSQVYIWGLQQTTSLITSTNSDTICDPIYHQSLMQYLTPQGTVYSSVTNTNPPTEYGNLQGALTVYCILTATSYTTNSSGSEPQPGPITVTLATYNDIKNIQNPPSQYVTLINNLDNVYSLINSYIGLRENAGLKGLGTKAILISLFGLNISDIINTQQTMYQTNINQSEQIKNALINGGFNV